jgi:nucleotide-binding universal stress UspA family protein
MNMAKHILVAIDGSQASMAAVEYLALFLEKNTRVKIDLLHILPDIPPLFLEPGESMAEMVQLQDFSERVQEENRRKGTAMIQEAQGILIGGGIDPANVRPLIREPSAGVARDILGLEQEHAYNAIVLGRHGMSAVDRFLMGSVTHKVLQHTKGVPLCVVHGEIEVGKLLITIDSSPNSKRVLEQAGWLLAEAGPMAVTILHVLAPLIGQEMASMWTGLTDMASTMEQRQIDDAEEMLSQAKTYLTECDIPAFAIKTRLETRAPEVAQAVLKEAREGGYGSIIIGRRGISRTRRFLFGSVSNKIVQQARDMAVWVVC